MLTAPNWPDLLLKVAPSSSGKAHLSQDQYSGELFQNILFTRLKELHSHKTHIFLGDLKSLLHNTKANLTILTLFEIILDDDHDDPPQAPPPSSPSFLPPSVFIPHPVTFSPDSTSYTPNSPAYCPAFQLLNYHLDHVITFNTVCTVCKA
jgi:hypothetical protein